MNHEPNKQLQDDLATVYVEGGISHGRAVGKWTPPPAQTTTDELNRLSADNFRLRDLLQRTNDALIAAQNSALLRLSHECHAANQHWWHDAQGNRLDRNKGELLMLIVSEIAEAMEGERKSLMDTHLPHRQMAEVELADALIRIFDYAGAYGFDLDAAVCEKRAYNRTRADHQRAAREAPGGKKW